MARKILICLGLSLSLCEVRAQPFPSDDYSVAPLLSPIGSAFNRIFNTHKLDSAFGKLGYIRKNGKGVFRIVQIGDSHIQAGFFPGQVRTKLQSFFGNAGRGLVFPYDAIHSTSPADLNSTTNATWKIDRVASTGKPDNAGVSGYGMRTETTGAHIEISLREDSFTRLRFFTAGGVWLFSPSGKNSSDILKPSAENNLTRDILLDSPVNSFTISAMPSDKTNEFYGVSLENDQSGILYHAIGVNGARYDQYNKADLFWEQLPALQADLYIVSLGTNDAQRNKFDAEDFRKEINTFLQKLSKTSPGAAVIITTAPDSFRHGRSNVVLRDLNFFLFEYCTEKSIPVWDLYRITNGFGSASGWLKRGLMNTDGVHFTAEGYQLQGQLFLNAFAKGYNDLTGN